MKIQAKIVKSLALVFLLCKTPTLFARHEVYLSENELYQIVLNIVSAAVLEQPSEDQAEYQGAYQEVAEIFKNDPSAFLNTPPAASLAEETSKRPIIINAIHCAYTVLKSPSTQSLPKQDDPFLCLVEQKAAAKRQALINLAIEQELTGELITFLGRALHISQHTQQTTLYPALDTPAPSLVTTPPTASPASESRKKIFEETLTKILDYLKDSWDLYNSQTDVPALINLLKNLIIDLEQRINDLDLSLLDDQKYADFIVQKFLAPKSAIFETASVQSLSSGWSTIPRNKKIIAFKLFSCIAALKKRIRSHITSMDLIRKTCQFCFKISATGVRCGTCLSFFYCSEECLTNDWPYHKSFCTEAWNIKNSVNKPKEQFLRERQDSIIATKTAAQELCEKPFNKQLAQDLFALLPPHDPKFFEILEYSGLTDLSGFAYPDRTVFEFKIKDLIKWHLKSIAKLDLGPTEEQALELWKKINKARNLPETLSIETQKGILNSTFVPTPTEIITKDVVEFVLFALAYKFQYSNSLDFKTKIMLEQIFTHESIKQNQQLQNEIVAIVLDFQDLFVFLKKEIEKETAHVAQSYHFVRGLLSREATANFRDFCRYCLKKSGSTSFKRCSSCHKAAYCSRDCQIADWPCHKGICFKFKNTEQHSHLFLILAHLIEKYKEFTNRSEEEFQEAALYSPLVIETCITEKDLENAPTFNSSLDQSWIQRLPQSAQEEIQEVFGRLNKKRKQPLPTYAPPAPPKPYQGPAPSQAIDLAVDDEGKEHSGKAPDFIAPLKTGPAEYPL